MQGQYLHLYNQSLTSPIYVQDMSGQVKNFRHGTRAHGGYYRATFSFPADLTTFWDWYLNKTLYRVVLEDKPGSAIWQGRVEDVQFQRNMLSIVAFGYWKAFQDRVVELGSTKAYAAQLASTIVQDIRDNYTNAGIFSSDNTQIESPGVNLTVTYEDKNGWDLLTNTSDGVANSTDSAGNPYFLMVYKELKTAKALVHFKKRSTSLINWQISLADLAQPPPMRGPLSTIVNSVSVTYTVSGTAARTTITTDADSIAKYGQRDLILPGLGEMNAATANNRRDRVLADFKEKRAELAGGVEIARLFDVEGAEYPLCRLKAGDIIRIQDMIPTGIKIDQLVLDGLRTFMVRETDCDHRASTVTAWLDTEDQSAPRLLAQATRRPLT